MAKDFFPDSPQNQDEWFDNLKQQFALQGPALGWSAEKITAEQGRLDTFLTLTGEVLARQAALDTQLGALRTALKSEAMSDLRRLINNIKSTKGYTTGMGDAMDILTTGDTLDPQTYEAELSGAYEHGEVRLTGKKRGVDALNIYWRRRGESAWRLLAGARKTFPVSDDSPLAQPNVPEWREYQAIAVVDDAEFGKPSKIVSVLHGG